MSTDHELGVQPVIRDRVSAVGMRTEPISESVSHAVRQIDRMNEFRIWMSGLKWSLYEEGSGRIIALTDEQVINFPLLRNAEARARFLDAVSKS